MQDCIFCLLTLTGLTFLLWNLLHVAPCHSAIGAYLGRQNSGRFDVETIRWVAGHQERLSMSPTPFSYWYAETASDFRLIV
jgi:hypothetical protein